MKTIPFNPLGETQREQWHTVVNILRVTGGDMTFDGRDAICGELDRYIDYVEDILDNLREQEDDDDEQ